MPVQKRMMMNFSTQNYTPAQLAIIAANLAPVPKKKPMALNSSIIGRIHDVRPGCGSCGK